MTLSSAQSFYNFTNIEVNESAIRNAFEVAADKYSELLVYLVSTCFSKTPEKRPDFIQFASLLEPYQYPINNLQPFDINIKDIREKLNPNYMLPQPVVYVVPQPQPVVQYVPVPVETQPPQEWQGQQSQVYYQPAPVQYVYGAQPGYNLSTSQASQRSFGGEAQSRLVYRQQ